MLSFFKDLFLDWLEDTAVAFLVKHRATTLQTTSTSFTAVKLSKQASWELTVSFHDVALDNWIDANETLKGRSFKRKETL